MPPKKPQQKRKTPMRTITMPDATWKRLQELAANRGAVLGRTVSPSEFLRILIDRAK